MLCSGLWARQGGQAVNISPWVCTLCWKCGVDDNLFSPSQQQQQQRQEGIYHRSCRGERDVHRGKEAEKALQTPTKHGYPNDSIMHWIHSVATRQRHYQSSSRSGMFFGVGGNNENICYTTLSVVRQHRSVWREQRQMMRTAVLPQSLA